MNESLVGFSKREIRVAVQRALENHGMILPPSKVVGISADIYTHLEWLMSSKREDA